MPQHDTLNGPTTPAGQACVKLACDMLIEGNTMPEVIAAFAATAIRMMEQSTGREETAGWLADLAVAFGRFGSAGVERRPRL